MSKPADPSSGSVDDILGEDHERLGKVLLKLTEAVSRDLQAASTLLADFARDLGHHMRWEEADLFPAVHEHATPEEKRSIESLEIDHARIRETLDALREALAVGDGGRARELLGLLDTYLKGHNYDEEHGVYEEADRYLTPEERTRLLDRFRGREAPGP